jgi:hypothetical protein
MTADRHWPPTMTSYRWRQAGHPQGIWVYQDPCKALQRLVTKDRMRTPQVRQSNANDRYLGLFVRVVV